MSLAGASLLAGGVLLGWATRPLLNRAAEWIARLLVAEEGGRPVGSQSRAAWQHYLAAPLLMQHLAAPLVAIH